MRILADESIDRQIVNGLRQAGHSVDYVAEMDPGISDDHVLNLANEESALLLTADKDFGELVYRQHRVDPGVVLIRLAGLSPAKKAELVAFVVSKHNAELAHSFTVITPGAIRLRRRIA
jgi:predicted nuclease of predicted toxin-antitoxin system